MTLKFQSSTVSRLALAAVFICTNILAVLPACAQIAVSLNDLSFFKEPAKNWKIVSDISSNPNKVSNLGTEKGTGILISVPEKNAADLFSNAEYGDLDLDLDYLLPKGSNSGIYLQGRYEIQLFDSWGIKSPKPGDNGGIYECWDESKPEGRKGYGGIAPRQNVSKAPGLWQHLKVSFKAPEFDASGVKKANAKILRLELNGVAVHENVELSGPTRGAIGNDEKPTGPLRFQGDHGAVAFKNIKLTTFDNPRLTIKNVKYSVYKGRYDPANKSKLPPEAQGTLPVLSASNVNGVPSEYYINYTGSLVVKHPGEYIFNVMVPGGRGILKVAEKVVSPEGRGQRAVVTLPSGEVPFELLYTKTQDWTNRSLSIGIAGPGIREYFIGDVTDEVNQGNADPILMEAPLNTMLRSFVDIGPGTRIVHAINIGSPEQVHYSYDLDKGGIVQLWRGDFLDATPMWYGRGDGSSRPLGAVQRFGPSLFTLARLTSVETSWPMDTIGSAYRPKGYKIDKARIPTFRYMIYNAQVEDSIRVFNNGQGIIRSISVQNAPSDLYARLAAGKTINLTSDGLYIIDDKAYYLQIVDRGNAKPVIRDVQGGKELVIPIKSNVTYSILF